MWSLSTQSVYSPWARNDSLVGRSSRVDRPTDCPGSNHRVCYRGPVYTSVTVLGNVRTVDTPCLRTIAAVVSRPKMVEKRNFMPQLTVYNSPQLSAAL